jgi:signal transduction histidine kinase
LIGITINAALSIYLILITLTAAQSIDAERKKASLLLQQNEAIQRELRIVSSERLRMASRVAHRLNNPLNYIKLSFEALRENIQELNLFIASLFPEEDLSDPDIFACKKSLDENFQKFQKPLELLELGIQKSTSSVAEIRALSGVDGIAKVHFILNSVFPETFERLFELRPEYKSRLTLYASTLAPFHRVFGNEFFLCNALEIFLSEAFDHAQGGLKVFESLPNKSEWLVEIEGILPYDSAACLGLENRLTFLLKSIQLSSEFIWAESRWSMRVIWRET